MHRNSREPRLVNRSGPLGAWALVLVGASLAAGCGNSSDGSSGAGGSNAGTGGTATGTGGATTGTGGSGSGGRSGASGAMAGTGGAAGGNSGACANGSFPTADPSRAGPFAVTTQNNVGPDSAFTMFRPTNLTQSGLCHPVVTWGNGTGATPNVYSRLLNQLASHGIVVIASNSENVGQGDPPPMLVGVTWVIEQNDDPSSVLYQRIDTAHIGATGHSQGAFATMTAGDDVRITTIAPIQGSRSSRNLHGPALLLCGGMDTTLPCSGHMAAFNAITQPVMLANLLAATHTNWIGGGGGGGTLNPYIVAVTGWMRVQLMGDTALRPMFYGPSCTLCQDTATWQVMQKMLD